MWAGNYPEIDVQSSQIAWSQQDDLYPLSRNLSHTGQCSLSGILLLSSELMPHVSQ